MAEYNVERHKRRLSNCKTGFTSHLKKENELEISKMVHEIKSFYGTNAELHMYAF